MNNNKKTTQKQPNRKKKFGIFLGIGVGALASASAVALIAQIKKVSPKEDVQLSLNFGLSDQDKQEGATITGKTDFNFKKETCLEKVETPVVEKSIRDGSTITTYPFVDWVDSEGNTVKYNDLLTKDTKLTATFSDYWKRRGETLFNVIFETNDPQDYLTGITKIAVPEGRTFASINKPRVNSTNPARNNFKGWALKDSTNFVINQDMIITTNLTFVPVFGTSIVVNYNIRSDETLASGSATSVTEAGKQFGTINQPTLVKDGFIFMGWTKDDAGLQPWTADEEITDQIPEGGYQAWAQWAPLASENHSIIKFVKNESDKQPQGLTFSGSEIVAVKLNSTWSTINRPTPIAAGWKLDGWEISEDQGETKTWTLLEGAKEFTQHGAEGFAYYVRPVMKPNADAVKILGKDTVIQGSTTNYSAFVAPIEADQACIWELYADASLTTKLSSSIATIDKNTGVLKTYTNNNNLPFYIKATSTVDSNGKIYDSKKVTVVPPYVGSYDYYTFYEDLNDPTKSKWYKLEGLCGDSKISLVDESTNAYLTLERKEFNWPVYVGENITMLPTQFLANCTNFNKQVIWTDNLQDISQYFMINCSKFNQKLDLSHIQNIEKLFMAGCSSFNNASTDSVENPLSMPLVNTIADGFMDQCTSFDSRVEFNSIKTIGTDFLTGCTKYNKTIKFPSTLTSVGDKCMYNCDRFQSIIYCNAPVSAFGRSDLNFCSMKKDVPIAKAEMGFKISGDHAEEFHERFKTIQYPETSETGSAYRNSGVSSALDIKECSWSELGALIEQFESGAITEADFRSLCRIGTSIPTSFDSYIGVERKLKWYGLPHRIRIVSTCMDDQFNKENKIVYYNDNDGVKHKATFVFEFANALTWSSGTKTGWMSTKIDKKNNLDLTNCGMRRAYDGGGNGEWCWISGCKPSDWNDECSALDYIPKDVKKYMKKAERYTLVSTNGTDWSKRAEKKFESYLFSPTAIEWGCRITQISPNITENDDKTFSYYRKYSDAEHRKHSIVDGQVVYTHFLTPYIDLSNLKTITYVFGVNFYGNWTQDCPIGSSGGSCQLAPCFIF